MPFIKYQHIERLGTPETDGILQGTCYIFPKIDGTNAQIFLGEDGELKCGSRNRDLSTGEDNHGFREWVNQNADRFMPFFKTFPDAILYGEWLVKHTLRTYRNDAWRHFYVFDVLSIDGHYWSYLLYSQILIDRMIGFIPPLAIVKNPSGAFVQGFLDRNTYLIEDGQGFGEGIVIKNYDYRNKFGRQTWAKIVRNEFKDQHWSNEPTKVKAPDQIEEKIAEKYVTSSLVEKEFAKIESESGWSPKFIPRLLNTIYYCVVKEEAWNFVKDHKNPIIDFRSLNQFVIQRIKQVKPEIF